MIETIGAVCIVLFFLFYSEIGNILDALADRLRNRDRVE